MTRLQPLALSIVLAGLAAPALATDSPVDDIDVYKQKFGQCMSQQASDHPEITSKQRKKACKAQLGPAPHGVVPAKGPAPVL